jgi:geranylgeranyl pyrophosphate synthase
MSTTPEVAIALRAEAQAIDAQLRCLLQGEKTMPKGLRQAMAHSLFSGGKRLRPILVLWTYDAIAEARPKRTRASRQQALIAGCAFEIIHTYSLIHDDLPAMDDDVLRRGRPTCHVAFGEATAILAGDGLHALAFRILAQLPAQACPVIALLASAAGPGGMVGGQLEDLTSEGRPIKASTVLRIHERKTARLISAAMEVGAWLGGSGSVLCRRIRESARWLGLAFQAADDLLDVTGTAAQLGKTAGKDAAAGKATWVRLEGLEGARRRTERYGRHGCRLLARSLPASPQRDRLLALGRLMWQRSS